MTTTWPPITEPVGIGNHDYVCSCPACIHARVERREGERRSVKRDGADRRAGERRFTPTGSRWDGIDVDRLIESKVAA